jgi:uncharacterized protein YnzC (UPF0291/DUF896 family)
LSFERKNDQAARRAKYFQNIKKQAGQSTHKLSTTTYSTNHQEALRAKYLKLSGSSYGKEFTK